MSHIFSILCQTKINNNPRLIHKRDKVLERRSNKSNFISVRFSTEEKEQLKKLAEKHEQTLSEFIRTVTLGKTRLSHRKIIPEINRELYFELGEALEQLPMTTSSSISDKWNNLQELFSEVRRELLGMSSR